MRPYIPRSHFQFKTHIFETMKTPWKNVATDHRDRVRFRMTPPVNHPVQAGVCGPFSGTKRQSHDFVTPEFHK